MPLITGIIIGIYLSGLVVEAFPLLMILSVVLFVSFILLVLTSKKTYRRKLYYGIILQVTFLIAGVFVALINTDKFYPNHVSQVDEAPNEFIVIATDEPSEKAKSFKVEAEVLSVIQKGKHKNLKGSVLLYLKKDSLSATIKYGDVFLVRTALQSPPEPQNPAQFNYKQFLQFHQITKQGYVPSGALSKTNINDGNFVMKNVFVWRNAMLNVFRKHDFTDKEFAVAAALILGYKDELDPETMRAYSGAGAMHVLAVSGLHVGILFAVASFFLSFFDKIKYGNIIKAILLILILSLYAMITGLSPSVLRAAVMFAFIIVAKSFNYHTNIYNTLAVSAIALLIYDPYLIMQVGFQLSYLAVIGIVAIQPPLADIWHPKTRLMNWAWKITCVSVAAQIATAPLGFLYFHQFPVYFMFSNLIVIPAATYILCIGLAMLATSFIPSVVDLVAIVLKYLVLFLNKAVAYTEALPYSILGGIDISIAETWLLYSLIVALFIFFTKRSFAGLYAAFIALLIISLTQLFETIEHTSQQRFVVYNVSGASAYDIIQGRSNVFFAPKSLSNDKDKMLFNVEHNWWKSGLDKQSVIDIDSIAELSELNYFFAGDKRVIVLDEKFDNNLQYSGKVKSDYVILRNNPKIEVAKLVAYFTPEMIIFDSSNSRKSCRKWTNECEKTGVSYYNVAEQGAFVVEL